MVCQDPDWMRTNLTGGGTFYPAGTGCYRDPSQGSCFSFGNSGGGVIRKFGEEERFAFTGPLSMSKSCDSIYIFNKWITYSSWNSCAGSLRMPTATYPGLLGSTA